MTSRMMNKSDPLRPAIQVMSLPALLQILSGLRSVGFSPDEKKWVGGDQGQQMMVPKRKSVGGNFFSIIPRIIPVGKIPAHSEIRTDDGLNPLIISGGHKSHFASKRVAYDRDAL